MLKRSIWKMDNDIKSTHCIWLYRYMWSLCQIILILITQYTSLTMIINYEIHVLYICLGISFTWLYNGHNCMVIDCLVRSHENDMSWDIDDLCGQRSAYFPVDASSSYMGVL